MFLPLCGPNRSCTPTMAIVGTDPIEKETNNPGGTGPADFNKPGAHRYIGIGMVVGLAFVVLVLWLTFARWPRRKMWEYGWLKQQSIEAMEETKLSLSPRVVDEIILPKPPEPATHRTRENRKPRRRRTLEPWDAELEYKVNWEMQQHVAFYEPEIIPDHRTRYVPSEKRSLRPER